MRAFVQEAREGPFSIVALLLVWIALSIRLLVGRGYNHPLLTCLLSLLSGELDMMDFLLPLEEVWFHICSGDVSL